MIRVTRRTLILSLLTLPLLLTACSTRTANDRMISLVTSYDSFGLTTFWYLTRDDWENSTLWHESMQRQREFHIAGLDRLMNSHRAYAQSHRLRRTKMSNACSEDDGFAEVQARAYERTAEAYAAYRDALDSAYAELLAADPDQIRATTLTRTTDGDLSATPGPVVDFLDALDRARQDAGPFIPSASHRRH